MGENISEDLLAPRDVRALESMVAKRARFLIDVLRPRASFEGAALLMRELLHPSNRNIGACWGPRLRARPSAERNSAFGCCYPGLTSGAKENSAPNGAGASRRSHRIAIRLDVAVRVETAS